MYNEDEINDSLEFCRDIDIFYEGRNEKNAYQTYLKRKAHNGQFSSNVLITNSTKRDSGDTFSQKVQTENIKIVKEIEEVVEKPTIFTRICNALGTLTLIVLLAYGISSFITNYCIWHTQVDGISMEPALEDGDRLIIDKISYRFSEPERFDIVVFPQKIGVYYVKRIIGLPGETIQIINGKIYVDGIVLAENYGNEPMSEEYTMELPVTLGNNQYFVLGDNRNYSIDSRDPSVGAVSKNYIVGKAWIIVAPKERMQIFK